PRRETARRESSLAVPWAVSLSSGSSTTLGIESLSLTSCHLHFWWPAAAGDFLAPGERRLYLGPGRTHEQRTGSPISDHGARRPRRRPGPAPGRARPAAERLGDLAVAGTMVRAGGPRGVDRRCGPSPRQHQLVRRRPPRADRRGVGPLARRPPDRGLGP